MNHHVLSIDIHQDCVDKSLLGITAVIIDNDFNEIDSIHLPAYCQTNATPEMTKFIYRGPLLPDDRQKEIRKLSREFKERWMRHTREHDIQFAIVYNDRGTEDIDPNEPYIHVNSELQGFLITKDPNFNEMDPFSRLDDFYVLPEPKKQTEVYLNGYKHMVLMAIKNGGIKQDTDPIKRKLVEPANLVKECQLNLEKSQPEADPEEIEKQQALNELLQAEQRDGMNFSQYTSHTLLGQSQSQSHPSGYAFWN